MGARSTTPTPFQEGDFGTEKVGITACQRKTNERKRGQKSPPQPRTRTTEVGSRRQKTARDPGQGFADAATSIETLVAARSSRLGQEKAIRREGQHGRYKSRSEKDELAECESEGEKRRT